MNVDIGALYAQAAAEGRLIEATLTHLMEPEDEDREPGPPRRSDAQVILPTRDMLERARVPDGGDGGVDVSPGQAVVGGTAPEGGMWFIPVSPADGTGGAGLENCVVSLRDSAGLRRTGFGEPADVPLFSTGAVADTNARLMIEAHAWLHTQTARDALDPDVRDRLATALHDMAAEVGAAHPGNMVWRQARAHMRVTTAYADAPLPDGIERYTEARAIAHRIARYEPDHELAAADVTGHGDILRERGAGDVSAEAGAWVRRNTGLDLAEAARMALRANDALCRQVFAPLTRTPIEDLGVSLLSIEGCTRAAETFAERGESLSGDWVETALGRVHDVIARAMPPDYAYDLAMVSAKGRDILLVREPGVVRGPGAAAGPDRDFAFGYAYSWPTADRRPMLELEGEDPLATVSPEEMPSAERLVELRAALTEVLERHEELELDPDPDLPVPAPG
ncbi:MAG: hypothetical protein OXE86_19005 [Alphaproteobacteria bacterium]|nr:hypothetical protein [Alphaproteobacteria bacterium]